jgi:hypothetical protein
VTDWVRWHEDYGDPASALSRRMRIVQGHISDWLDDRPEGDLTVVSACAGQGRDLIEVLGRRGDAGRVHTTLLEADPGNVAAARAAAAGLSTVDVRRADAGDLASYRDATPADLVLMVGACRTSLSLSWTLREEPAAATRAPGGRTAD